MMDYEILAISPNDASNFIETRQAVTAKILSMSPAEIKAMDDDEDEENSYILSIANNVGIINISGGLTGQDRWYNRFIGMTSYNEIKRAIAEAMSEGVGSILFNVSSPGGEVSGMNEVANVMSNLPIPTVTFGTRMCSAAYFLGSQADYVYADSYADIGSVGVLVKLYDVTEMNKKAGITVERFRSGDLKAVGDPNFKLTDKERTYISSQIQTYANKFFEVVVAARGMTLEVLEKLDITSGRTFIGAEAMAVNLVDGIVTFEQAMLKAIDLGAKNVDNTSTSKVSWMVKK